MSTTSKSPRKVALVALEVGRDALPPYSHRYSPRKFTQPQLFACLVLKEFFKTDYRGIAAILADSSDLRQVIALAAVPHFTTLQKAAPRLLRNQQVQQLLDQTIQRARPRRRRSRRPRVQRAAVDSSGFEAHHASHYFVQRRAGCHCFAEAVPWRSPGLMRAAQPGATGAQHQCFLRITPQARLLRSRGTRLGHDWR